MEFFLFVLTTTNSTIIFSSASGPAVPATTESVANAPKGTWWHPASMESKRSRLCHSNSTEVRPGLLADGGLAPRGCERVVERHIRGGGRALFYRGVASHSQDASGHSLALSWPGHWYTGMLWSRDLHREACVDHPRKGWGIAQSKGEIPPATSTD